MNAARVQQILEGGRRLRILVVGDVMLDEFVWGKVSRISPEAPVPVVEVTGETSFPGGAANVARNLRAFCGRVTVCGIVGRDGAASRLEELLRGEGIETDGLVGAEGFPTIVKTRIIARQQQVVRVDRERRDVNLQEARRELSGWIEEKLGEVDGVIFEDYGKGLIDQGLASALIGKAVAAGKVVTVDPNPGNPLRWSGVHLLKPNRQELFSLAGVADRGAVGNPLEDGGLKEALERLGSLQDVGAVLVTLGEQGMLLAERGREVYHIPTRAKEVFDVSGAGDTAIALMTLAMCAGATLREAAEISNHASGIVVGKLGTATVMPEELLGSFAKV